MESLGRVLAEKIVADRDFPPFDRVSMDGIAINSEAFNKGQRTFLIEGIQPAGSPQISLQNKFNCIEAMTGAIIPNNADTVIPYEQVTIENGEATTSIESIKNKQNIHLKGTDRKKGDILIAKNTVITAAEIGVLATVGKSTVLVKKQPKVVVVSTGNELVEVTDNPAAFQIRRSNVYTVMALLNRLHIKASEEHIIDDKNRLRIRIKELLSNNDVLIFSGAVSKGKFDFIPEIMEELGVKKHFHTVKQRPGKPFWFGTRLNKDLTNVIFAFPGNPVSTFVNCVKYFYPWYQKSMEIPFEKTEYAILDSDYSFKPNLTYFLQVKLYKSEGALFAKPITGKGSGDLANLINADGFLELPDNRTDFLKGELFPVISFRN